MPAENIADDLLYLEHLVDKIGPRGVIEKLGEVCRAKEEHLQVNWQDRESAKAWGQAAAWCETRACASALKKVS